MVRDDRVGEENSSQISWRSWVRLGIWVLRAADRVMLTCARGGLGQCWYWRYWAVRCHRSSQAVERAMLSRFRHINRMRRSQHS